MSYRVHIKLADRGWILEKCASEIARRSPNITVGDRADPSADIQYYVNYSARSSRVSPIELAFFTHAETSDEARGRYLAAARDVDTCICMSARYADDLRAAGVRDVLTISPGVDHLLFKPQIRVGVVGRTYHTGRKGEALVASVMDIAGIEWRFTGSGWPGPAMQVADGEMPAFYNGLDYLLVPSLYEGGPMSVLEALACGVPVISSDVGWVNEFPHIAFENGDAASLRAVLTRLVEERGKLAAAVEGRSWDAWGDAHIELFDRLGATRRLVARPASAEPPLEAVLITHGSEGTTLGGPSVRVPQTARALATHGVNAHLGTEIENDGSDAQVAHVFNVWPIETCIASLSMARDAGKRVVLSPIFLNLSTASTYVKNVPQVFEGNERPGVVAAALRAIARRLEDERLGPLREINPGYHGQVRAASAMADGLIFLSQYERECLTRIGATWKDDAIVRNPVDAARFRGASETLFAETYGVDDYILCVGRLEPRKNQLMLAHAAKLLGKPVVFIGHDGSNRKYADLIRSTAGEQALFIPRLRNDDPLLAAAYAGASVFCLPSWAEGAPLSALEAAATGVPLVLSNQSGENEYFGDYADYVHPADIDALQAALLTGLAKRGDSARRTALQDHIAESYTLDRYAEGTAGLYRKLVAGTPPAPVVMAPAASKIFIDITTSFTHRGPPTGIARLEHEAFRSLLAAAPERLVPLVWHSRSGTHLQLQLADALDPAANPLEDIVTAGHAMPVDPGTQGGRILVLGSGWMRNPKYINGLARLKHITGAELVLLVHDLAQIKLRGIYPDDAGAGFEAQLRLIVPVVDSFLVYSETTARDLGEFLRARRQLFKRVSSFRLGTGFEAAAAPTVPEKPSDLQKLLKDQPFALYVSSIDPRKNHVLLINIWRRLMQKRGGKAPHLVCIGRPIWGGEALIDGVWRDRDLASRVHFASGVGDDELSWFYRNATLTLYPSLYEGWGLPIEESLSYGKLCIVSAASSMQEVAPTLTDLIDPYDFTAWYNRILLYFDNPQALAAKEEAIHKGYRRHSWDDAAVEMIERIDATPTRPPQRTALAPGAQIAFGRDRETVPSQTVLGDGWDGAESVGRWMIGREATLAFDYLGAGPELWVRLHARALAAFGKETRPVRVSANGIPVATIDVPSAGGVFDVMVTGIALPGPVSLAFSVDSLLVPASMGTSKDTRTLGIALGRISVSDVQADLPLPAKEAPKAAATGQVVPAAPSEKAEVARQRGGSLMAPRRPVSGKGRSRRQRLLDGLARLEPIESLPQDWLSLRIVRAIGLEPAILRIHERMFRRSNAATREIIAYLRAELKSTDGKD